MYLYNDFLIGMKNNRRDFLKTACAPVAFSVFGISMLEACSATEDDDYGAIKNANNNGNQASKTVTIDLSDSNFSNLSEVGGWMNYTAESMLLLRVSDTQIRAFSNVCPHAGAQNQWSHANSKFTCSNHGRSFNDDCSGSGLKLTCYTTNIQGDTLTVTR